MSRVNKALLLLLLIWNYSFRKKNTLMFFKQPKISDKNEPRFGVVMTPFSSSKDIK